MNMSNEVNEYAQRKITRDEFIDGYMERAKISPENRTRDGFVLCGIRYVAAPCDCGDEMCQGWQKLRADEMTN